MRPFLESSMAPTVSLWPLIGVAVIVAGFILRLNPVIIVVGAAIVTACAAGFGVLATLNAIGAGFLKTRNLTLALILPLATIGLLERHGLRQHTQDWIRRFRNATAALMTPMAANFNIVPAALLELPDKNAVIRAQWPTALTVLVFNIVLLYILIRP
jgi:uncharacterized membrane protein